jgi:hypothetical protein
MAMDDGAGGQNDDRRVIGAEVCHQKTLPVILTHPEPFRLGSSFGVSSCPEVCFENVLSFPVQFDRIPDIMLTLRASRISEAVFDR